VERLVYIDGAVVEESRATVSVFDRGFLWGDGVYEITPCFDGRLFRLPDHLDRLFRSLRYVGIAPQLDREAIERATLDLLEANSPRLEPGTMHRVGHFVSRGPDAPTMLARDSGPPTVCILLRPVDLARYGHLLKEGARLTITPTRRVAPETLEARAKVTSKMNQILAELDADASGALSLMLDRNGFVTENSIANFFMVRDGGLWTAPERNVLEGVTRKVVFELADGLGLDVVERDFSAYDLAQADEYFLTSSAYCAIPVARVDRFVPQHGSPGPVTSSLIDAFARETGFDLRGKAIAAVAEVGTAQSAPQDDSSTQAFS
jgi:branched-chain amino acid aminotransferase